MAEGQSMTTEEVVREVMKSEHADFLAEAVAMVARELMDAEIAGEIGARLGEVSPERTTHRNGYRPRAWETRVGEIELAVPRKRSGEAYFPSFLEPRKRSEQAIVSVVMEAYVNGVSTRKVDRLVEQLGIHGMTRDRVSALCRGLDPALAAPPRPPASAPRRARLSTSRFTGMTPFTGPGWCIDPLRSQSNPAASSTCSRPRRCLSTAGGGSRATGHAGSAC